MFVVYIAVGADAHNAYDMLMQVGVFLQHTATFVTGFIVAFTRSWDMTLVLMGCLPFLAGMGGIMVRLMTVLTNKATAAYTDVS
jgi:ATP-binding cassette subfamily B (MDR/TAP) protein 1